MRGGIEAVLRAMAGHPTAAAVQEDGYAALNNLAADAANKTRIAEAGGIETINAALRGHRGNSGVQAAGNGALDLLP